MSRLTAWLDARINPIALAELRRGLRARLFGISLSLMLLACVAIALFAWADGAREGGKTGFVAFYSCAAVVLFWILPYNAWRSVAREQEEKTLELVVLTGMTAASLLLGKIQSQLIQAVLFGSVAAPFLLVSFLLQGIDLLGVLLVLAGTLLLQPFLTVVAASSATFYGGKLQRNAGNIGGVLFLGWMTSVAVALAAAALESNARAEVGVALGIGAWLMVSYGALALAAGVGRLTFASDNRVYWSRLALLVHLAGSLGLALLFYSFDRHPAVGVVLALPGLLHAFIGGILLGSDLDGMSRRVRQQPPRVALLGLLLPGARRGLWTFALLVAAFAGSGAAMIAFGRPAFGGGAGYQQSAAIAVLGVGAFVVLYVTLPLILARGPLRGFFNVPQRTRAFCVFFLFCAVVTPPLMLSSGTEPLHLFNPIRTLAVWAERGSHPETVALQVAVLGASALITLTVCDRVLAAREREADVG